VSVTYKEFNHPDGFVARIRQAQMTVKNVLDEKIEYISAIPLKSHPKSRFGILINFLLSVDTSGMDINELESLLPQLTKKRVVADIRSWNIERWFENKKRKHLFVKVYEMFPFIPYGDSSKNEIKYSEKKTHLIFEIYKSYPKSIYAKTPDNK
jgi:hypothetical protein